MTKVCIKMLKTAKGAEHGYDTLTYDEGNTYEVEESLAEAFTEMGVCEPAKPGKKESRTVPLTLAQLKKLAADNKVNIKGLSKEADIISALEAAGVATTETKAIKGAPENK